MKRLLLALTLTLLALLLADLSLAAGEWLTRPVRAPLLVAAGTLDLRTRWPETEALFAAAPAPKALWPVPGAAHVDLYDFDPAAYEARLGPWLQSHLRKSPR